MYLDLHILKQLSNYVGILSFPFFKLPFYISLDLIENLTWLALFTWSDFDSWSKSGTCALFIEILIQFERSEGNDECMRLVIDDFIKRIWMHNNVTITVQCQLL